MEKNRGKKVVVITGASSGIGGGLKKLYEEKGDTVIGLSRTDCGGRWKECDVTDGAQVSLVIDEIGEEFKRIDVLINNAGVGVSGAVELTDESAYERVMSTNAGGVFNVTRASLKYMERGGRIINISSTCALFALPFRALYCAAKAAVNMLSFGLRMELKDSGICVIAVCPGEIKTNFTANRLKNFSTNERYGNRVESAADYIDSKEDKRMDCGKACRKIFKIAEKGRRAQYIIGVKYKALDFARRFVSADALLNATNALMGGK